MTQSSVLVVGLGNPGSPYTITRHNLGFLVIEAYLAGLSGSDFSLNANSTAPPSQKPQKKYRSEIWEVTSAHQKIRLAKPQTFMNRSGEAVLSMMSAYKLRPAQLFIVYDDVSLPFGKLKVKHTGSSGGHNGVASIIKQIGKTFTRLKCGIGPNPNQQTPPDSPTLPLDQYVLSPFNPEEKTALATYCKTLASVVHTLLQPQAETALSHINGKTFQNINPDILKPIHPSP